jgi:preprotein translocase subunit SecF
MGNKAPLNINFMAPRKVLGAISLVLVIGSLILLGTRGLNLGMDFTGGTTVAVHGEQDLDTNQVRETLENHGFDGAVVQHYGSARDVSIRVAPQGGVDADKIGHQVFETLTAEIDGISLLKVEFVGPQVGDELRDQSGLALLLAMSMMLLYVWFRFTNKFAVATVSALIHDVIITLGLFSLLRWQVDLTVLAAVLALIGYSLNDSIVVADRVRENFRGTRETDPTRIINQSINETLSRTINTSFTTLLVLVVLLLFGGEVTRGFSEALLVGVFIGTYSSIYVVTNLLFLFKVSKDNFLIPEKEEIDDMP